MKTRRRLALILAACLLAGLLCGCGDNAAETAQTNIIDDNYRNWYEVFVYSYFDSDGDGIGDLNGVTEKLDYISELGMNGIWLMPIMPSPSYHKYDVTDYYGVDEQYGSLDDMKALLEKAHERGIRVIIDLPVNHTSSEHPWFVSASADENSPYRDYYVWSDTAKTGYTHCSAGYYESRFVSTMPDLNLDNEAVRDEIAEIMRFWLEDVGVDGFRLDAVTSYYTGAPEKNIEFISWLGETAREYAPDCFIVGEAWEGLETIAQYSAADIDSFFAFPVSQRDGYIARTLSSDTPGTSYGSYTMLLEDTLPESTVAAPFIANHDTSRAVNFLGRKELDKTKMAAGLLAMMRGGVFVYYGEEIGMAGTGDDPNKRLGMLWTTEDAVTETPPGTAKVEYVYPGVETQLGDSSSLLSYYKNAMLLRNQNPEIARGDSELIDSGNDNVCIIRRTWNGASIIIVLNISETACSVGLDTDALGVEALTGSLTAGGGEVTLSGGALELPGYSIAIIR